ncbi:MAG TPA: glycoside hydrolase family 3 protein [Candidatus Dormibacteraeota bacterium]|nr:glycoside hydrolase family 3 protein [Candidatus Dormibacteraeota bacterium]
MTEHVGLSLSLEAKIGQLCAASLYAGPQSVERLIRAGQVGAILLYYPDFEGPVETAELTNRLQELAPVPLLIQADFEMGAGRLLPRATMLPSLMAVGATGSAEMAREHGRVTAVESRAAGINHVFAPVVDVNVNPGNPIVNVRALGGDPGMVSELAAAWIEGCEEAGALACAKHFPGHGDTTQDSHVELPTVPHDLDRMQRVELAPFRAAIASGVGSIMTAHVSFPSVDPSLMPATLSQPILTGLLRDEMGFQGIVVTDAMVMYAVWRHFEQGDAAVRAIEAGADLVLTVDPELSYAALLEAARSGRLSESRIDQAVGRLLRAKERLGLLARRDVDPAEAGRTSGTAEHREIALRIARAGLTLLKGSLAADPGMPRLLIAPDHAYYSGGRLMNELARLLRMGRLPGARLVGLRQPVAPEQIEEIVARRADARDAILLSVSGATAWSPGSSEASTGQAALVQALAAHLPVRVISLGSPYVLPSFTDAAALACTYGAEPVCIEATLDALAGRLEPSGRMPVELPGM